MDRDEAFARCICAACPSYAECEERRAFCVIGKSKCIKAENGCICAGCPVYSALKLSGQYYCIKGMAQSRKEVK
jgi:hypothetical protein